jgi:dihydrofolate reductase
LIISMIVAIGPKNEIGLDNQMLWHIPADFKHFKETTMGHHMIMGRKTFDSIGRPLPGRTTIVVTRNEDFSYKDVLRAKDLEQALSLASAAGESEVFITGGAEIYKQYLPITNKIYLSKVDYKGEADTHFPVVDFTQWECQSQEVHPKQDQAPAWELEVWSRL